MEAAVTEDSWHRRLALKVRTKGFGRLKEDKQSVVFGLESVDEQQFLTSALPKIYFITDHYRGWPTVLAHLSKLPVAEARKRLERAKATQSAAGGGEDIRCVAK